MKKSRKLIAAAGAAAVACLGVLTLGTGAASAETKECTRIRWASERWARVMDAAMDVGAFDDWDWAYTMWLGYESAAEVESC